MHKTSRMKIISLDPRVNRMGLDADIQEFKIQEGKEFVTWEVFHQKKKGMQHLHAGIVHAPNAELALVVAKESFGRRGATTSLWVVRTSDINAIDSEDSDIFESTPEKLHREAGIYATRDKIEAYITKNQTK